MKSPFPGMDPYLEARWNDVHTRLCTHISAALQPALPRDLRARAQEDVILETVNGERLQEFEADSVIVRSSDAARGRARSGSAKVAAGGALDIAEPLVIEHVPKITRDRWVEIIDTTAGNRVVTAIEILSPGNKESGALNKRFRRKLTRYIQAGVNLVEIDLLRTSRKRLEIRHEELPPARRAPYLTCVHRADDEGRWEVYPMPLRQPLPVIAIPCRPTDPDVPLALQPLIDRIYAEGGHDDIDYTKPPHPPLNDADAAWAASLRASRG